MAESSSTKAAIKCSLYRMFKLAVGGSIRFCEHFHKFLSTFSKSKKAIDIPSINLMMSETRLLWFLQTHLEAMAGCFCRSRSSHCCIPPSTFSFAAELCQRLKNLSHRLLKRLKYNSSMSHWLWPSTATFNSPFLGSNVTSILKSI